MAASATDDRYASRSPLGSWLSSFLLALIALYQSVISPLLGPNCRFHPTCSSYAAGAIQCHGPFRGLAYAIRRIVRCHPWNPGGFDPVPSRRDFVV